MQGTRIKGKEDLLLVISNTPGGYGTIDGKNWFCTTPTGLFGNISKHEVIEHEDGTITVSPSILVTTHNKEEQISWHGYLERGIWRSC